MYNAKKIVWEIEAERFRAVQPLVQVTYVTPTFKFKSRQKHVS